MTNKINLMEYFAVTSINSPKSLVSIRDIINDTKRDFDICIHDYSPDWYMGASVETCDERLVATEDDHAFFKNCPIIHMPPFYILTIEHLRVYGHTGIYVTGNNELIYESALKFGVDWNPNRLDQFALFKEGQITPNILLSDNDRVPAPQFINAIVTILPNLYDAYGHQLVEIFSNFLIMKDLETQYLYCKYSEYPFVQEAFDFLGIPKDRIIPATVNQQLIFRQSNIILPKHHSIKASQVNKDLMKELGFTRLDQTEKIFILRRSKNESYINLRYIINREELRHYLVQKGFREVHWEELRITEKIETISKACFIVEDFSSGNLNTAMWARNNTKILRIYSPAIKDTIPRVDERLLIENVYGVIIGDNLQPPEFLNEAWRQHFEVDQNFRRNNACFTVDIEKLDYVITEMDKR
ncbi:glycosyltransferase 61 family protein [Desulfopila sp. IMCC35008]|uniref:glycosyltransferase 61 family protein n=1 Tax=Desulfopila sp. IMCC35008 TaxID=2653858 RepID=UPI0013D0D3B0|nr:glycosyltransferase 61 family protein [Desulfopila sp. IMCC35008]